VPLERKRKETDIRAERFESEVRMSDLQRLAKENRKRYMCSNCNKMFEERSVVCPRCEKKTMNEIRIVPEQFRDSYKEREIKRLQSKYRR